MESVGLATIINIRIEIAPGSVAAVEMVDEIRRLRGPRAKVRSSPKGAVPCVAICTR